jgi:hypothetical protein
MSKNPRRRWFQFSIATMLLLITVFAVWLGWNLTFVRQREAAITYLMNNGATVVSPPGKSPPPWKQLPIGWRILRARIVIMIFLPKAQYTERDREELSVLFPEANIKFSDH